MYNGIGLQTARGSGTNGYVVKNLSSVRVSSIKQRQHIPSLYQNDPLQCATVHRKTSEDILKHQQKRKIEIKVLEYQDSLEESGDYRDEEDLKAKVDLFRLEMLLNYEKQEQEANYRQAHEADLKEEENERFRSAFGISHEAKEGAAFRFEEQAKRREIEKLERAEQAKRREQERAEKMKAITTQSHAVVSAMSSDLAGDHHVPVAQQGSAPVSDQEDSIEPSVAVAATAAASVSIERASVPRVTLPLSETTDRHVSSHSAHRDSRQRSERSHENHRRRNSRSRSRSPRERRSRRHHSRSRSRDRSERHRR